ncbi:carbohydrate kinase family protein [Candidatus Bathyarchaeota archaeon]|nr:carbohydrate kinase family protein [Candidatus Bathyarchaeota archaeon]
METNISDVAVVGHFSVDSIILPSRPHAFMMLGGSVTYVSLVAKRLEASASVISKVGGDFPEAYLWWLKEEGIDISGVVKHEAEQSTRFELEYSSDLSTRILHLKGRSSPLTLADLPIHARAKALHVAPIDGEISYEVIEELKKRADVLSLDPQGLLRTFDEAGNVYCCTPMDRRLLSLLNVYKSTLEEIIALTGESDIKLALKAIHDFGVDTVIVTMGAKGAVLSVAGSAYNIPVCTSAPVDPTGAGDVFIGGFLTEYIRAKDSLWCACVGSAAASVVVEGLGATSIGEKEEIYRRAESLYEKGIKQ